MSINGNQKIITKAFHLELWRQIPREMAVRLKYLPLRNMTGEGREDQRKLLALKAFQFFTYMLVLL